MIIGIAGYARSGKDHAAGILRRKLEADLGVQWNIVPMAGPMKDACRILFGFDDEQLYGDTKEQVDEYWGKTPRWTMQYMGTEFLREHFGADFHIRCPNGAIPRANRGENVIVPDIRFPNEVEAVHGAAGLTGVLIKIVARGGVSGGITYPWYKRLWFKLCGIEPVHPSERYIRDMQTKYVINNGGSLQEFETSVARVAEHIIDMFRS